GAQIDLRAPPRSASQSTVARAHSSASSLKRRSSTSARRAAASRGASAPERAWVGTAAAIGYSARLRRRSVVAPTDASCALSEAFSASNASCVLVSIHFCAAVGDWPTASEYFR